MLNGLSLSRNLKPYKHAHSSRNQKDYVNKILYTGVLITELLRPQADGNPSY